MAGDHEHDQDDAEGGRKGMIARAVLAHLPIFID